ncbi:uncharacterized protein BT62DRAFT_992109 [Guyanagaster necrorhizus]|uniref:Uncharacterized protein n=1 Tax=Guyanagaster necrorhizus TaxID=856835 RepID=A0A9P7W047_9AGAR|nr:uncharacterized protein BT62DRAFT_992109 [Guyanagaster necrorhizus MCA 3950]KAG7448946.1 hypothetical protein BT62DRAFT_992109 [Guyanagaster necrorhizus MCA 3950]
MKTKVWDWGTLPKKRWWGTGRTGWTWRVQCQGRRTTSVGTGGSSGKRRRVSGLTTMIADWIKPTRPPEPPRKVKEKEKESNLIWRQPPTYALNAPVSAVPPSAAPVLTTWALNPHTKGNQAVSDPTRQLVSASQPGPESDAMDIDPVAPQPKSQPKAKGRRWDGRRYRDCTQAKGKAERGSGCQI